MNACSSIFCLIAVITAVKKMEDVLLVPFLFACMLPKSLGTVGVFLMLFIATINQIYHALQYAKNHARRKKLCLLVSLGKSILSVFQYLSR